MHTRVHVHLGSGDRVAAELRPDGAGGPYVVVDLSGGGYTGVSLFIRDPEQLLEFARKASAVAYELAAVIEGRDGPPVYQPRFDVVDGIEKFTDRLACCGAGADRSDPHTGERLHLPACRALPTVNGNFQEVAS